MIEKFVSPEINKVEIVEDGTGQILFTCKDSTGKEVGLGVVDMEGENGFPYLYKVNVDDSVRGQGLATTIIKEINKFIIDRDTKIYTMSHNYPEIQGILEKNGWEKLSIENKYSHFFDGKHT